MRPQTEGEAAFAYLKGEVQRKELPKLVRAPWISKETWRLVYRRESLLLTRQVITREVCKAWRDFQHALQEDRCRRVQVAGLTVEGLMAASRVKEA